jgi:hypothetical protein
MRHCWIHSEHSSHLCTVRIHNPRRFGCMWGFGSFLSEVALLSLLWGRFVVFCRGKSRCKLSIVCRCRCWGTTGSLMRNMVGMCLLLSWKSSLTACSQCKLSCSNMCGIHLCTLSTGSCFQSIHRHIVCTWWSMSMSGNWHRSLHILLHYCPAKNCSGTTSENRLYMFWCRVKGIVDTFVGSRCSTLICTIGRRLIGTFCSLSGMAHRDCSTIHTRQNIQYKFTVKSIFYTLEDRVDTQIRWQAPNGWNKTKWDWEFAMMLLRHMGKKVRYSSIYIFRRGTSIGFRRLLWGKKTLLWWKEGSEGLRFLN